VWEKVKAFFGWQREDPIVEEKNIKNHQDTTIEHEHPNVPHMGMYGMYGPPFGMMGDYPYFDPDSSQDEDEKHGDGELK